MSVLNQKTLKETIAIDGVGLHSGKNVHIELKPAKPNTGIIFKRTDIKNNNFVVPGVFNVIDAAYSTTISNEYGVTVSTIEHLMGALFGMGIDNALIEINNEEVPILDGSAKIFVSEINRVGIKTSETPMKIIKIEKKVSFEEGTKSKEEPSIIGISGALISTRTLSTPSP